MLSWAANKAADMFHLFIQTCWGAGFLPPRHLPVEHYEAQVLFFNIYMESLRELQDPFTSNAGGMQPILFSASQPFLVRRALSPRYFTN